MLDKLKTAIVLVIIGAVSGALIFGTNALTKDGIAAIRLEKEQGYYREIFNLDRDAVITTTITDLDGDLEQEIIVLDNNGDVVGYIYKGTETNNYGEITVLVGIDVSGVVTQVVISSTTNTPIFVNIIETDYLGNLAGQDTSDITFDERTGASFTYGSVEHFVTAGSTYYNENRGGTDE